MIPVPPLRSLHAQYMRAENHVMKLKAIARNLEASSETRSQHTSRILFWELDCSRGRKSDSPSRVRIEKVGIIAKEREK